VRNEFVPFAAEGSARKLGAGVESDSEVDKTGVMSCANGHALFGVLIDCSARIVAWNMHDAPRGTKTDGTTQ